MTSGQDGVIWAGAVEGGDLQRLTDEDELAGAIVWAPDGSRFSYESSTVEDGPRQIVVRDANGSNKIADEDLTTGPFCSRDGAFCGQCIYHADADGSGDAVVIGDLDLDARNPVWSPDGTHISGETHDARPGILDVTGVTIEADDVKVIEGSVEVGDPGWQPLVS